MTKSSTLTRLLPVLALLAAGPSTAGAAVILDTFAGVAPGHTTAAGWALRDTQWIGRPLTVSGSDYSLDSIVLPIAWNVGETTSVLVTLQTDTGGSPSGTILESWTINHPGGGDIVQVFTNTSALNPVLIPGTYHIVASSTATGNNIGWSQTNDGHTASIEASSNGGGTWASFSVIDVAVTVNATAVPEAGTATIALGGLLLTGLRRRRA